jgi:hypothetical protein
LAVLFETSDFFLIAWTKRAKMCSVRVIGTATLAVTTSEKLDHRMKAEKTMKQRNK